jgi:small subunit ribosomal protein S5
VEGGQSLAKNLENKEYKERVLKISRVSKTTTGGRSISFSVLAAVGDENGKIGIGLGKANGVPDAIKKAIAAAKKNVVDVSLKGTTIPHEQIGKFGATSVLLKPAHEGTGVIAGSAAREILELVGVHNILTKIRGSKNKLNVARATVEGLKELRTAAEIAKLRGKEIKDILS